MRPSFHLIGPLASEYVGIVIKGPGGGHSGRVDLSSAAARAGDIKLITVDRRFRGHDHPLSRGAIERGNIAPRVSKHG